MVINIDIFTHKISYLNIKLKIKKQNIKMQQGRMYMT